MVFSSGVMVIILFIAALFLYSIPFPPGPRHDIPEGFDAGFLMILAAAFSMLVSGALAMFLTFDDISYSRYALAIPLLSGLVFIHRGLTGLLAETISFGFQNLPMTDFWVFVCGLMAYLPAYSLPNAREAHAPKWYHYPVAAVVPIALLVPLFIIVTILIVTMTHL